MNKRIINLLLILMILVGCGQTKPDPQFNLEDAEETAHAVANLYGVDFDPELKIETVTRSGGRILSRSRYELSDKYFVYPSEDGHVVHVNLRGASREDVLTFLKFLGYKEDDDLVTFVETLHTRYRVEKGEIDEEDVELGYPTIPTNYGTTTIDYSGIATIELHYLGAGALEPDNEEWTISLYNNDEDWSP